jgi:hypothetical protein
MGASEHSGVLEFRTEQRAGPRPAALGLDLGRVVPPWWIGAMWIVVAVWGTAIVLVATVGGARTSAAADYDRAYRAFHARLAEQYSALQSDLNRAAGSAQASDPAYQAVVDEVHALQGTFDQYGRTVAAIAMPATAASDADRLGETTRVDAELMRLAGVAPTASDVRNVISEGWQGAGNAVTALESALRGDLSLTATSAAGWPGL